MKINRVDICNLYIFIIVILYNINLSKIIIYNLICNINIKNYLRILFHLKLIFNFFTFIKKM